MNAPHSTAELLLAVLPITAVEVVNLTGRPILLVGSGSSLKVVDANSQVTLYNGQVLLRQAIHGIVPLSSLETRDGRTRFDVLVYGGRQVSWIVLDIVTHGKVLTCSSLNVVDRVTARDWILSCKKPDNSQLAASFVTSYNALYHVEADSLTEKLNCRLLADAVGVFLYSADLIQRSEKSYLIASGTVFGQVLVWLCAFDDHHQKWIVSRHTQFNGHHGSIFGVNISKPRFSDGKEYRHIVSCSDDRMLQVWDLPAIDVEGSRSHALVSDDFEQCDQAIAKTYGHVSRIWNVDFISNLQSSRGESLLVSTGEDGQVQSWLLSMQCQPANQPFYLVNAYVDRHHAGKNIWARGHTEHEGMIAFFTGGADGQIICRRYNQGGRADVSSRYGSQSFKAIQSMIHGQTAMKTGSLALKTYIHLDHGYIMATTDAGQLLRGNMTRDPTEWESVAEDHRNKPLAVSTTTVSGHAFFTRTSDYTLCAVEYQELRLTEICSVRPAKIANIWAMDSSGHDVDQSFEICVAISYYGREDIELYWIKMNQGTIGKFGNSSVLLPTTFEVTSCFYDRDLQVLVCGSRAGALAVFTDISSATVSTATIICNRRVHGQDTVTSICKLTGDPQHQGHSFYLTTGGDGTYCIHKLDLDDVQAPTLKLVHQASPLMGPRIEGANVITQPDGSQVILLHGFHSKSFVVWNEIHQTQVMSVDCGGSHRSWIFSPDKTTGTGGKFVWTKAGTFMFYDQVASDHEIIQHGGHGREIKALATNQLSRHRWLLATGSEDTDIRLFEYNSRSSGTTKLKNIAVIRRHTTGLQDLQISPDGKILISAAGMEELYAWSLTPVPVIGQGVVFLCALTSTDTQSDARIMSFDMRVLPTELSEDNPSYLIVAAFSNGRLKTIQLNPATETTKAHFTVLHQLDFGTICLTQAHLSFESAREPHSTTTIVGATNGSIEICFVPLSEDISSTMTFSLPQTSTIVTPFNHNIHQNSITALQAHTLTPTHQLLVTGGDDNALAITLISTVPHSSTSTSPSQLPNTNAEPKHIFKSLLIPNAHAAALTALRIIPHSRSFRTKTTTIDTNTSTSSSNSKQHFTILSAGNDQRLQLWDITIDTARLRHDTPTSSLMEEVEVKWLGEWYTDVADISGIDVLEGSGDNGGDSAGKGDKGKFVEVVVVGVGMEVVSLNLDGSRPAESNVESC